jgi:hypothetical protein
LSHPNPRRNANRKNPTRIGKKSSGNFYR